MYMVHSVSFSFVGGSGATLLIALLLSLTVNAAEFAAAATTPSIPRFKALSLLKVSST
jgi:hypothetical protein